ncbi:hypothetical protein DB345_09490 [Spartobacteria bacterium LR76]|nr:hypothetical protein DB345_09490 [Spartobacteria bacterium LR76]
MNTSHSPTHSSRRSVSLRTLSALSALAVSSASAATVYWDPSGTGTYTGDGTWDTTTAEWQAAATGGGTPSTWSSANVAGFVRGTSGTVTVDGAGVTAAGITVGPTSAGTSGAASYTFQTGALTLSTGSSSTAISVSNGSSATFNNALNFSGGNQKVVIQSGASSLTIAGGIQNTNASADTLTLSSYSAAGVIDISGALTKSSTSNVFNLVIGEGAGGSSAASTFKLGGNNTGITSSSTLRIERGVLVLNNSGALGTAASLSLGGNSGATADSQQVLIGTSGVTIATAMTLNSADTSDTRTIGSSITSGTATFSGMLTMAGTGVSLTSASGGTTVFSSLVTDGSESRAVTKIGAGIVSLTRAAGNTYDGGTTVSAGTLLVSNTSGSGTGTGAVSVTAGTFGGTGQVSGAVTIGNGTGGSDSFIVAGNGSIGTFTTSSSLSLNSDATFTFELNSSAATADKLVANGVVLNASSVFAFSDLGASVLTLGTAFTIIDNTSASAISGTFSNLTEGETLTIGSNQFEATYLGGTGNDLVLTVVPEPSATLLLSFGLCAVIFLRRRVS